MSDLFPKWTNQLPLKLATGALIVGATTVAGFWYFFTPQYTQVGYQPRQPVAYSHATHVGQLGMDCRYCHAGVEQSAIATIPAASVCMNCHNQVLANDPRLSLVRESVVDGRLIPWLPVHRVPDYVYFHHAVHVRRGVGCVSCHGQVDLMEEVYQAQPMSMSFCLDCHRNPAPSLRPLDKVMDLSWDLQSLAGGMQKSPHPSPLPQGGEGEGKGIPLTPALSPGRGEGEETTLSAVEWGQNAVREWKINASQDCSACHR